MENLHLKHRCYNFQSKGKIIYDPIRNGVSDPWSAIVEVEQDIADYARYHFLNQFKVSLLKPNWKPHISLFRGEVKKKMLKNLFFSIKQLKQH